MVHVRYNRPARRNRRVTSWSLTVLTTYFFYMHVRNYPDLASPPPQPPLFILLCVVFRAAIPVRYPVRRS